MIFIRFLIWWTGQYRGTDAWGNRYYENPKNKKRWVIYQGEVEASKLPPLYHNWMHGNGEFPTCAPLSPTFQPNLTGTLHRNMPQIMKKKHLCTWQPQ